MKVRDSGMPERDYWNSFFDPDCILRAVFGEVPLAGDVLEFGCGYGTFSLPAAGLTRGTLTALDIEAELVRDLRDRARAADLDKLVARQRDFLSEGAGVPPNSQAHVMIYNLLHLERPLELLAEARRVMQPGGRLSVIHWRVDVPTPRGPPLEIRPAPRQVRAWLVEAGLADVRSVDLSACCAYHYGVVAQRPVDT